MSISGTTSGEMSKMDEAVDVLCTYLQADTPAIRALWRDAHKSFHEDLDGDEDKKMYVEKLKEHVYYHLIVLRCRGNEEAIQEWIDDYWEEWVADNLEM